MNAADLLNNVFKNQQSRPLSFPQQFAEPYGKETPKIPRGNVVVLDEHGSMWGHFSSHDEAETVIKKFLSKNIGKLSIYSQVAEFESVNEVRMLPP